MLTSVVGINIGSRTIINSIIIITEIISRDIMEAINRTDMQILNAIIVIVMDTFRTIAAEEDTVEYLTMSKSSDEFTFIEEEEEKLLTLPVEEPSINNEKIVTMLEGLNISEHLDGVLTIVNNTDEQID